MSEHISYNTYQILAEKMEGYEPVEALKYVKKQVKLTRFELMGHLRSKYPETDLDTIGRALKIAMQDKTELYIEPLSLYNLEIEFS